MSSKSIQTATVQAVVVGTSSVELIPAGTGQNYRSVSNISGQILYLRFGLGTATATAHTVPMASGAFYEFPVPTFNGSVQAILATGSGTVLFTTY